MPALRPSEWRARVVWLGLVRDRAADLAAQPVERIDLGFAGPVGDSHSGLTRAACSRVAGTYRRGRAIRNARQLAIMSAEDLAAIARTMGLAALDPGLLGVTMVLEGLADFSHLPPSSRLVVEGREPAAGLVVDMENRPCHLPAPLIEARHPGHGGAFRGAAKGRRGIAAWVEAEGEVRLGDSLRLHLPDQPAWRG